jgi:hypothetical protein
MAVPSASQNETQLLKFLDGLDMEGESARSIISKNWDESLRQLRGDQWRMGRSPHFMANIIRNQVEKKVASLTEVKPTVKVVPGKIGIGNAAHIINQAIKAIWDRNLLDMALHRMAMTAMTLGSSFISTYYDPAANNYIGDIAIRPIDPRRVWIDPAITEAERLREASYIITESFDTLGNIRMRFPGRGMGVKSDMRYTASLMTRHKQSSGLMSAVLRSFPQVFKPGGGVKEGPIGRAVVREYWIRDPQLGQDGKMLFPTGRHIIRSGDIVLADEANPYWDGMWPIDMFDWSMDFDSPWGLGEVSELRRIQEAFNRIGDGIIRNALLSNNIKVIADMDALEPDKWDELTNEGGIIIKKRPGREISYDMPKEMPGYLFQLMTTLVNFADMLTGNVDVTGGKRPSGVVAASAIEGLQVQSQTLVRMVSRRIESLLERVGEKLVSRVIQFYNSDRVLQMLGPSREWVAYAFERNKIYLDDKGNIRDPLEVEKMFHDFKFLVVPGSSLASTRVQRTMLAMNLRNNLGIPVPSIKTILREADLGDPDEMIQDGYEEAQKLGLGQQEDKKKKS